MKIELFAKNNKKIKRISYFESVQDAIKIGSICPFTQEFIVFKNNKPVTRFCSLGVTYSIWKLLGYVPDCILSEN